MISTLERFRVDGLHGRKTLDVTLRENTLVLVGENGSGKTTFLRILFSFLAGRWGSLVPFSFESITATIGGVDYQISHAELAKAYRPSDRRFLSTVPPSLRRRVQELLDRGEIDRAMFELERHGVRHPHMPELLMRQMDLLETSSRGSAKGLQEQIARVREAISAQVLYLPTYRRIERELSSIFENTGPDEFTRRLRRPHQDESSEGFIELVEFGMKDVEHAVARSLERLKEFARENLNTLTLRYLGDVVDREYENVGMKDIEDVPDGTARAVLDRIHDSILSSVHKDHLVQVISSATSAEAPTEHQKIIYHYFLKLLSFQRSLQENERHIAAFCALCSEYIVDKRFVYDSADFSFSIVPSLESKSEKPLTLSDLSSGEKQIVSLFSHLYLSGREGFFVLIDEPELSLSVPWQRRFLMDIRGGDYCRGLVAVTHSPFIYDNPLRQFAHSVGEFVAQ